MIFIQVPGVLFALAMIYISHLHFRRSDFSKRAFMLWTTVWITFLLLIIFAGQIGKFSVDVLHFSRFMDFVMVLGMGFVAIVTFMNFSALSRMKRKLEMAVREQALSELERKDKANNQEQDEL